MELLRPFVGVLRKAVLSGHRIIRTERKGVRNEKLLQLRYVRNAILHLVSDLVSPFHAVLYILASCKT